MAGKKIGLVLALDGEKEFTQSMRNAGKEINLCKTELKNLSDEFKDNANSMDALKAKQEALTKQQDAYQKKLNAAKSGLDNAKKTYDKQSDALEGLKKKLEDAEKAQKKMEDAGDDSSESYKNQCKQVEELSDAVNKQTVNVLKASGRVTDWNQKVSQSENELKKANKALDQNEQYLREAEAASDRCATSIDKFGKEVKDTADDLEDANQKSSTFGDVLKANLASGAIINGVKAIGSAAKEGAEALIEMATDAAAYADEILTASTVTRMSTDDLQAYSYAAELVDVSLETLTKSMAKNVKSMDSARDGSESYVEAYKKLGVSVTDANGELRNSEDVYWDVIDALGKVSDETERDAISMQIFGKSAQDLNPLIAQGSEGIAKLKDEAREMGAVLDGDALSALGATDDSLQRLNQQTEIFKRTVGANVAPVVQDVAEAATKVLSELTDAINPPKSELEQFIDDIKASNDEVQRTLDSAQSVMDGATADVAELEAYKQVLMDLNEQESLTEFQKYQLVNAVQTLGDSVPGLTEAFNEETGTLTATNEELEKMFQNAEAVAMQNALLKAEQQTYEALAQATLDKARADDAVIQAQKEYNSALERNKNSNNEYEGSVKLASDALWEAQRMQEDTNATFEDARKQANEESAALERVATSYGLLPEKTEEAKDGIEDVADSANETKRVFDEYGNDITGMSEEQANAVTEASKKIVDAYSDMRDGIADSIKGSMSLFDEFSGGEEITADKINENLQSQITGIQAWSDNMNALAGQIGKGFSQELYDELAAMGPEQSASAVQALVDALNSKSGEFEEVSNKWSELLKLQENADSIAEATSAGKKLADAVVVGIEDGTESVSKSSDQMVNAGAEAVEKESGQYVSAGGKAVQAYTEALNSGKSQAAQAGGGLGSVAYNAVAAWQNSFYSVGTNMALGVAQGIYNNQSAAINAASTMARNALKAAKDALEIKSPSKKFKEDVGKQVGKGFAFGIKDSASLAGKEAKKMSGQVYTSATEWLKKYKKDQKVSVENERYYWQQILEHTKKGSSAYKKAKAKLAELNTKYEMSNNFGVSWYTTKNKKKVKKDAETYYSEVLSAAQTYYNKITAQQDMSIRAQKKYWTDVQKTLKNGTKAWVDAQAKIDSIKAKIGTVSNASSVLSAYQTYYNMSEQAVVQYWDTVRQQYEAGTDERLEADQKYFEAKQDLNEKMEDLEKEHADKLSEIDETYNDKIKALSDDYEDQLKQRSDAIRNAFGLFDAFESESADGKTLLFNIKAQAAGYEDWMNQLNELEGKGILNEDLLEELREQGPEMSAAIHALNSLSREELAEYNAAYLKKMELSQKQAEEESEKLRQEIQQQTDELEQQRNAERQQEQQEYERRVAEINSGMTTQLKTLADNVRLIAEDQTTALVAAIKDAFGLKNGAESSTGDNVSNATKAAAGVTADGLPSANATTADEDKILAIINKYPKTTISKKDLEGHSALFKHIYNKYGRKPGNKMYNELADELGIKVDKEPTPSQRKKILDKLKEKGYRSGGRNILEDLIWMDEDIDTVGPEMIVRQSDNAILTRIRPGDSVVNADTVSNMARWAQYDPGSAQAAFAKMQEQLVRQQETLRNYAALLNDSGIVRLNQMLEQGTREPVYDRSGDISKLEGMMADMIGIMSEFLPMLSHLEERQQIVLDTGAVVGGTVERMSNQLAMRTRRRR